MVWRVWFGGFGLVRVVGIGDCVLDSGLELEAAELVFAAGCAGD